MGVFLMPSLGADMEQGKLVEWLVKPGDTVARGATVAVVETQKGAIEIEIFESGVVERLEAQVGQTLPVGAPLAVIAAQGATEAARATPQPAAAPAPPPERAAPAAAPQPAVPVAPGAGSPPPSSPAARKRAAEAGITLEGIAGSGPGGAILLQDVEDRLAARPEPVPKTTAKPGLDMVEMRKAIAAAMSRSKREIPHYYLSHQIDLQPATDWLAATNAKRPPEARLLMGALLLKAAVRAATSVPETNGTYENGAFHPSATVNAGLVVALRGGGLIAPAILDAQALSLDALMAAMGDVVTRSRSGRLRNSELTSGTLTVSSMGEAGSEALYGVIYPPQVALIGFGAPRRRPWVIGDAIMPRTVITVTLAADHRVSDGRQGARLLTQIEALLQEPDTL